MALDDAIVSRIAEAYTAAWNSGSAGAVSMFYADDGRIVINRGSPVASGFAAHSRGATRPRRRHLGSPAKAIPHPTHIRER
jgi:hypothetical protein